MARCQIYSHHEGPSATEPQPNKKERFHHEGREEHEVRAQHAAPLHEPLVSFVIFVVRSDFLMERENLGEPGWKLRKLQFDPRVVRRY
jgi:hypothetical protein